MVCSRGDESLYIDQLEKVMPMSIKQQDFYAGLLFIIIGVTALIVAQDYQVGTARRMGPGYFPTILGVGLALVGVATCIRGLCGGGEEIDSLAIRPMMFVLLSVVAFGVLLERGGLVLATLVLCALAASAARGFRGFEVSGSLSGTLLLWAPLFSFGGSAFP